MDDYISKPIQPKQMFSVLSRWIGKSGPIATSSAEPPEPQVSPMEQAKSQIKYMDIEEGTERLGVG
jgi:hypothetical protein